MENLTPDEQNTVLEFRKMMKSYVTPEVYADTFLFYKFLKARNFNLKQAEAMMKKSMRWRKEMQIDRILTDYEPAEVLKKYVSQSFVGYDKDGSLIMYAALGNTDGKGLFKASNKYEVLKCIVQVIEENLLRLKESAKKLGKPINQCVYIYDMENMTLAKATHKQSLYLFMDGVSIIQDNYPEMLKRVYIINASLYFTIAYSLVKTILASAIVQKIRVFGETGWKEELLKTMDPEVIPVFLGGNKTDPDGNPYCKSFVNRAGDIPESYYHHKDVEAYAQNEDVNFIRIERQDIGRVPVQVSRAGQVLHWEFLLKSYDIGFGLQLKSGETTFEELIPVHKIDTENEPQRDNYICEEAGTYYIIFDNSSSWFYSKEIFYKTWTADRRLETHTIRMSIE